VNEPVE
jgi:hypothetical protein